MPCWYFERKEIKYSPSNRDGIDPATENRYRREGARFILDAGTKLGLYPFFTHLIHLPFLIVLFICIVESMFYCYLR